MRAKGGVMTAAVPLRQRLFGGGGGGLLPGELLGGAR